MKTKKKVTSFAAGSPLPALMKKLKISPAKLSGHVMSPAHIQGIFSDNGPEAPKRRRLAPSPRSRGSKHLDVENFASGLHAALKKNTIGYCMRLQKAGKTIYTLQWNWAQTPDDDAVSWNPSRRMHVASVSKLITAIAMTKLLDKKKISYDAKIIDYLPTYWGKGTNIKKITFRHLMTHTSGFSTANGDTDYLTMKLLVLVGVQTDRLGKEKYENINFGLCRILIAIISGLVDKKFLASDEVWDLLTICSYVGYVETEVFGPSGVSHATLDHPDNSALAYYFPSADDGWDSGNLEAVSGGAGWHLSINDLLKVMSTFRRKGTIMKKDKAEELLDNKFGVSKNSTSAGTLYVKNGLWRKGTELAAHVEQCVAYFLPEDMEMAVFVNSYVGLPPKSLEGLVTDIYEDHLK